MERIRDREIENFEDYSKKYGFVEVNMIDTIFEGIGVLLDSRKVWCPMKKISLCARIVSLIADVCFLAVIWRLLTRS